MITLLLWVAEWLISIDTHVDPFHATYTRVDSGKMWILLFGVKLKFDPHASYQKFASGVDCRIFGWIANYPLWAYNYIIWGQSGSLAAGCWNGALKWLAKLKISVYSYRPDRYNWNDHYFILEIGLHRVSHVRSVSGVGFRGEETPCCWGIKRDVDKTPKVSIRALIHYRFVSASGHFLTFFFLPALPLRICIINNLTFIIGL